MAGRWIYVASFCVCGAVSAQTPDPTVEWTAAVASTAPAKRGAKATLELSAEVQEGWHVYALVQEPGGPTPLRVTLETNPVAELAGKPSGSEPEKTHDPRFNLDTQFYTHSFALRVPVQLKQQAGAGTQQIPVSVRFQTCSERECQPPKTVRLSVPVDVVPDA